MEQTDACLGTRGPRGRARAGFTLVECVVALGVVGVGLSAVLAMVPVGMEMARGSAAVGRAAQLAQRVLAALSAGPAEGPGPFGCCSGIAAGETVELFADTSGADVRAAAFPEAFFRVRIEAAPGPARDGMPVCVTVSWPPHEENREAFVTRVRGAGEPAP